MPVYSSRDLIPFVNQLEQKINEMNNSFKDWDNNKYKILNAVGRVDSTYTTSMTALVRADEALAEISTACFKSTANRGKRLEDTLNKLKNEIYEIAATIQAEGGGGGALTEGVYYDELNNAIASVDATIEDGMKLDYRLREIQEIAATGVDLSNKELYMPYKHSMTDLSTRSFMIPQQDGIVFVDGEVTVLNQEGDPFLDENNRIITGTIDANGQVELSTIPPEPYNLYFPVQMKLKDIPMDFLYLFMQQMLQKNSRILEVVLAFEHQLSHILEDIEYMKGINWTPDFSIMRNHQELVKEGITPKGLSVEVVDGMVHVTFSYNDHPYLSHFILEKWDEEQQKFVPYDGLNGIVNK
jgi:hypothetical protein